MKERQESEVIICLLVGPCTFLGMLPLETMNECILIILLPTCSLESPPMRATLLPNLEEILNLAQATHRGMGGRQHGKERILMGDIWSGMRNLPQSCELHLAHLNIHLHNMVAYFFHSYTTCKGSCLLLMLLPDQSLNRCAVITPIDGLRNSLRVLTCAPYST